MMLLICNTVGSMKLSTWMKQNETNMNQVAIATEISPSALSRFLSGETTLSAKNMQRIVKHTGGAVSLDDLIRESETLKATSP